MNAPGGKHPILCCTWRKNPEERRVSDQSAESELARGKNKWQLQQNIDVRRHQEVEALLFLFFFCFRSTTGRLSGSVYYSDQETRGGGRRGREGEVVPRESHVQTVMMEVLGMSNQ